MSNEKASPDEHTGTWRRCLCAGPPAPTDGSLGTTGASAGRNALVKGAGALRRSRHRLSVDELMGSRRTGSVPHAGTRTPTGDADHAYLLRVATIADQISSAVEPSAALELLRQAAAAMGAEHAAFVSFEGDGQDSTGYRFLLACDPHWRQEFMAARCANDDPWLSYARHHSEAAIASTLTLDTPEQQQAAAVTMRHGFVSTLLVPAHSGPGHSRISLLCLGSTHPGHFENGGHRITFGAKALTLHLHDWWLAQIRRELVMRVRISASDLELLSHERLGHSSKHIARALQISEKSVNSRFQRMLLKLGVPNRRKAAKLAAECGLIQF
jgi:DNA-binding CsgD family transcriptional regulator